MNKSFINHSDYINSIRFELILCDTVIKSIKQSKEYKQALNYYNVLYQRGITNFEPSKENGYKIPNEDISNSAIIYKAFFDSIRNLLIEYESKRDKIVKSKEYKQAMNYFRLLFYRGKIKQSPNSKNGYMII